MLPSPSNPDGLLADLTDPHLSLHAVAAKHNTTLPALVLWMSVPANAAQLDSYREACAAHARLVATSLLPTCVTRLDAIAQAHLADATTAADNDQPAASSSTSDTTAALSTRAGSPLRYRRLEAARRALSAILRVARWQDPRPVTTTARAAAGLPVASTSSRCRESSESPTPRAIEVAALGDFDAISRAASPVASTSSRCRDVSELPVPALAPLRGAPTIQPSHPVGVAVATTHPPSYSLPPLRGEDSEPAPALTQPDPLPPNHQSPLTDHFFAPFAPLSRPSRSKSRAPASLLTRAGTTSRLSRAGPSLQTA